MTANIKLSGQLKFTTPKGDKVKIVHPCRQPLLITEAQFKYLLGLQAIIDGKKRFELRQNDRDFKEGDRVVLQEWKPTGEYTGLEFKGVITYVLTGPVFGLPYGYCVFGFAEHHTISVSETFAGVTHSAKF
jgi:hypothetical protein